MLASGVLPASAAAGELVLAARAGLDGVTRPGRWTPVVVTLDNRSAALTGDLVVAWGDTRVRQAVELAAPSATRITLFVRTGDIRDSLSVHVESGGARVAGIDVPLRIAPTDAHVILCLGDARTDAGCTVSMPAAAIPPSPRAFDAADEVVAGAGSGLSEDQMNALQLWIAARRVEIAGSAAPATGARPRPSPRSRHAHTTTI